MMTFIKRAIVMIDFILAPNHIMMIGPNATLGNEFRIVRKGSSTLAKSGCKYNMILTQKPIMAPNKKATMISSRVIHICIKISPLIIKLYNVSKIALGEENINLFIKANLVPSSQSSNNKETIDI